MKRSLVLLVLLTLVSCGKSGNKSGSSSNKELQSVEVKLEASRDYNPSSFTPMEVTSSISGTTEIPEDIEPLSGSYLVGTGWVTLSIAGIQYCYQGNAVNANDANGTLFELQGVKVDMGLACEPSNISSLSSRSVNVSKDDEIKLDLNGGGVSSSLRGSTLVTISIETKLTIQE